jgi:P-type E1-E2 ATPase
MLLQAFKDLYEDCKRVRDDREENEKECHIFDGIADFETRYWKDCRLGSIVKVNRGEKIPADLLVLFSSDSRGEFSVSTSSLDGETNLKQRNVPKAVMDTVPDRLSPVSTQSFLNDLHLFGSSLQRPLCIRWMAA